jgi:heme/copper-type cytochrome/quinol oxidase subunit 2
MTYLIVALVLACVIGSAIGWELSKNKHPTRQIKYMIGSTVFMVLFVLVVEALVYFLDRSRRAAAGRASTLVEAPMDANRSARLERSALECADMAAKAQDPRARQF